MSLIPTPGGPADTDRLGQWLTRALDELGWVGGSLEGAMGLAENEYLVADLEVLLDNVFDARQCIDTALRRLRSLEGLRPEIRKAAALRAHYSDLWRGGGAGA